MLENVSVVVIAWADGEDMLASLEPVATRAQGVIGRNEALVVFAQERVVNMERPHLESTDQYSIFNRRQCAC